MSEFMFVNWECRPAVIVGPRAWAVLARGEDWKEVHFAEVSDSGTGLSRERFEATFSGHKLPPLPKEATESARAGPADLTAAE